MGFSSCEFRFGLGGPGVFVFGHASSWHVPLCICFVCLLPNFRSCLFDFLDSLWFNVFLDSMVTNGLKQCIAPSVPRALKTSLFF